MTEIRTTSSTGGEKGVKPERYDLIPVEAMAKVAQLYGFGAKKYAEHNWRKGYEWSKSYAAMQRHMNAFWSGEEIDPETGLPHLAAVVFHALALMTFMEEHRDFDDRYLRAGKEDVVVTKEKYRAFLLNSGEFTLDKINDMVDYAYPG
ncbi:hypothetical protein SEA_NAPOLEONB_44 [Arthrobacter phage NapoleonB]|uniref:dATP/dGTP diphosphohydrolase N-terminal domain-containing protein n=2 Tax=Mudcatvirus TaxID=1982088 RepID=A0AAE8XJX1_9CAUD|nr:hypothetical protein FDH65_gp46 [Arthrobacter phage Circum]YP_010666823.1 hypothetical protein PQB82_gp44 [Arthrobacter phage Dynamite]ALY08731.1 hypothetical protein CIRCUM_46 [Arthrobacter phage Circum]QFP95012.1 hypothetical protein SEA_NAPOLEONB_44 [Arthrobacter phage NapoleonB]UAW09205.1 hypothetical protein SEA_DYNAMITE_44 [Arthrobacter phage Dynamite]